MFLLFFVRQIIRSGENYARGLNSKFTATLLEHKEDHYRAAQPTFCDRNL